MLTEPLTGGTGSGGDGTAALCALEKSARSCWCLGFTHTQWLTLQEGSATTLCQQSVARETSSQGRQRSHRSHRSQAPKGAHGDGRKNQSTRSRKWTKRGNTRTAGEERDPTKDNVEVTLRPQVSGRRGASKFSINLEVRVRKFSGGYQMRQEGNVGWKMVETSASSFGLRAMLVLNAFTAVALRGTDRCLWHRSRGPPSITDGNFEHLAKDVCAGRVSL